MTRSIKMWSGLVVGVIICSFVFSMGVPFWTAKEVTFTVSDKDRVVMGKGAEAESKYLVFTDIETFENTDCGIRFKFNSSDVQGKLKVGERYTAVVYGWRVPWLSQYRNIVKVVPVVVEKE